MNDTKSKVSSAAASSSTTVSVERQKRIFKIIVIGDSNVGKTCLTFRFCGGSFPEKTEATIGVDFRERTLDLDHEQVKVSSNFCCEQQRLRKGQVKLKKHV